MSKGYNHKLVSSIRQGLDLLSNTVKEVLTDMESLVQVIHNIINVNDISPKNGFRRLRKTLNSIILTVNQSINVKVTESVYTTIEEVPYDTSPIGA